MDRLLYQQTCGNIICGVAKDKADIEKAEKLRYDMLLMEFNENNVRANKTDKSEYDDICDHLIAIDTDTDEVVGTYRVLSSDKKPAHACWVTENEFDITNLKNTGERIIELSRAVVHADYRNGVVIKMLWKMLSYYCAVHNVRYLFGTASYRGVKYDDFKNSFAWLKDKFLVDKTLDCVPCSPSLVLEGAYDLALAKEETPSLIKGYLAMGCKVADGAYIDYEFGSIDVLTILDLRNITGVLRRILR